MNRLLMLFALLAVIRKRLWSGIRQAGAFLALPRLVLCLFLVSGFSDQAHAHSNGRVYPIVEITDAQLSRIEFDGLIHDWEELGEPTMTFTRDFRTFKHWQTPDLADLDFRIWLRWHDKTNREP